jgi:hypothetical protein
MKRFLFAATVAFGLCHAALAADSCTAQADAKKLAGAARASFTKKCEADSAKPAACEDQATTKKLAGAAKTSFMKKCEADSKAATATTACESQAADKKLAGAAKNSFMKKCVADAKG